MECVAAWLRERLSAHTFGSPRLARFIDVVIFTHLGHRKGSEDANEDISARQSAFRMFYEKVPGQLATRSNSHVMN